MTRSIEKYGVFAFLLIAAGCPQRQAPAPAAPPAAPTPLVEGPPPVAQRCERLEENCLANETTKARIKDSGFSFGPPPGWVYAQEEALSIASSQSAAMAVTVHDVPTPKKEAQSRQTAAELLVVRMGVVPPKKKLVLSKKPADTIDVGPLKVSLWEIDKAVRGNVKGALLVFWAKPGDKQGMTGAGFVADDDTTTANEAILKAVKSIGKVP